MTQPWLRLLPAADMVTKLAEWLPITGDKDCAAYVYNYVCDLIKR